MSRINLSTKTSKTKWTQVEYDHFITLHGHDIQLINFPSIILGISLSQAF